MATKRGCTGGNVAGVNQIEVDCDCVGIESIDQSSDLTRIYINLTNGTTDTFTLPAGATGPEGPAGPAGTSGTNGTSVIANQFPDLSTLGTAFESLIYDAAGTARTPFVLPANTLATDQSEISITATFTTSDANPDPTQLVRVLFNGNATNTPLNIGFYGKNIYKIIISVRLVRLSNTTAKYEQRVYFCTGSLGGDSVNNTYVQTIQPLAGLNFTTDAYEIDAQGNSDVAGDITCAAFEALLYKK